MGYAVAEVAVEALPKTTQEIDIPLSATSITLSGVTLTASPTASGFRYQPDAVFMGEEIQRRSEPSFGEMLNGQPGVAMRSMGSEPARPVIRSMDGDRILVLENGERMGDISETSADHSISLDPLAASRVEVIRGPASLLYGSSALGGVINLMTTDIPDQWDPGWSGADSVSLCPTRPLAFRRGQRTPKRRWKFVPTGWPCKGVLVVRGRTGLSTRPSCVLI